MSRQVSTTFGLPEFYVTEVEAEVDSLNVRIAGGVRRRGVMDIAFVAIVPHEMLQPLIDRVQQIADCLTAPEDCMH